MTPHEILNHLTIRPFAPFRILLASGREFGIRHPEFVKVGLSTVTMFTPSENESDSLQQWEELSLTRVESTAPLESAAGKNGR